MWNWLKGAGEWIWDKLKQSPALFKSLIKTNRGKRIVAIAIVWALHLTGVTVAVEWVVEALTVLDGGTIADALVYISTLLLGAKDAKDAGKAVKQSVTKRVKGRKDGDG